jgi:hypothetical protein
MKTTHTLVVQFYREAKGDEYPHEGKAWYDFVEESATPESVTERLAHMQKIRPADARVVERVVCESVIWPKPLGD